DSDYVPTAAQPVDQPGSGFRVEGAAHFGGDVTMRVPVVVKTAAYEITSGDSNTCFVNSGGTADLAFTLPAATAGFTACVLVDAAHAVVIRARGKDIIQMSGAGGTELSSSSPGSTVTVIAIGDSKWLVLNRQGTWNLH